MLDKCSYQESESYLYRNPISSDTWNRAAGDRILEDEGFIPFDER
jgi:hypothetical protein